MPCHASLNVPMCDPSTVKGNHTANFIRCNTLLFQFVPVQSWLYLPMRFWLSLFLILHRIWFSKIFFWEFKFFSKKVIKWLNSATLLCNNVFSNSIPVHMWNCNFINKIISYESWVVKQNYQLWVISCDTKSIETHHLIAFV